MYVKADIHVDVGDSPSRLWHMYIKIGNHRSDVSVHVTKRQRERGTTTASHLNWYLSFIRPPTSLCSYITGVPNTWLAGQRLVRGCT